MGTMLCSTLPGEGGERGEGGGCVSVGSGDGECALGREVREVSV